MRLTAIGVCTGKGVLGLSNNNVYNLRGAFKPLEVLYIVSMHARFHHFVVVISMSSNSYYGQTDGNVQPIGTDGLSDLRRTFIHINKLAKPALEK